MNSSDIIYGNPSLITARCKGWMAEEKGLEMIVEEVKDGQ